jgi:PAS domain S-box-containing protein
VSPGGSDRPARRQALPADEEDRLLASLVHSVVDYAIFALDRDGFVRTWNPGAERLKGYTRDEIVGQHFGVFYPEVDLQAGKPELELALASAEGSFEDEGWRIRKDGSRIWANVVITAIRDADGNLEGFGKVTRDLTERKRGEDALRESEERFSLLITSVADYAIFLLEPDGTVASWNLGAERLKGYRPDEIIGRHFSNFYTQEDRRNGLPESALVEAVEKGRWENEGWRVRRDGTRFWANVVITALRGADGSHRGFAKVTRDLSDRKRNEDALRGVLDRERETANRLRELDRLKSDLIAVVAHDLRGPVGVVQSVLQMATEEWDSTAEVDRRDLVERAHRRIERLAVFVDDVFDAARIDTGELVVATEPFDIVAIADQVVADARVASPDRTFELEVGSTTAGSVLGDPQRTWQILANLVSNAVKFSPGGSTVTIAVRAAGDDVVLAVTDDGPGVPEEQRELLFQRFGRLPQSATTPGAGLGLYIARSLAEAQAGTLAVTAEDPARGATFTLTLPAAP